MVKNRLVNPLPNFSNRLPVGFRPLQGSRACSLNPFVVQDIVQIIAVESVLHPRLPNGVIVGRKMDHRSGG